MSITSVSNSFSTPKANSVNFQLIGDAATLGGRMSQTNLSDADKYEWELMYTGNTESKIAENVNFQVQSLTGNGNYVNNTNYVNSAYDDADVLYENSETGLFLDLDWRTGNAALKNKDGVAEDLGLVDSTTGQSAVSFIQTGKNVLVAHTVQQVDGATYDEVNMSLNQSAFNSKWGSSYWSIYNTDLNKGADPNNTSEYILLNTMMGYWPQYFSEDQAAQVDSIEKFIELGKEVGAIFEAYNLS